MRSLKLLVGVAALTCFAAGPALAQRGNSGNHGPSTHGPSTHGPSTHGPGSTGSTAKNNTGSSKHGATTSTSTATTTQTVTAAPTTVNFTSTAVGQKLTKNTALQSKLATKLTTLGYTGTVFEAAYGFKNLGQFVAATNVAQNLQIPFELLKLQMTGLSVDAQGHVLQANLGTDGKISLVDPATATSPAPTKSLGQSIQTLKSSVDATTVANTATVEAENEIEKTTTTSTTTTQVAKNSKKKS